MYHLKKLVPQVRLMPQSSKRLLRFKCTVTPCPKRVYSMCNRRVAYVRPEKFQFLEKGQNRNFDYKIVISVKNP